MDLVTVAEIDLFRPRSANSTAMGLPSDPRSGVFVVADGNEESLREQVMVFAEQCGVDRSQLNGLRRVASYPYTNDARVVVFDIPSRHTQYSTPYATYKAEPALKIGNRFFKLAEMSGVSE